MGELGRALARRASDEQTAPPQDGKSVGGFLGNVVGDITGFVGGLSQLLLTVPKDVVGEVAEKASLGAYTHSSTLDDMFKAVTGIGPGPSAVIEDYKQRYGSVEGFKEGLYEDSLAFLGDLLTVATLGGSAAAKGAQVAARTPSATRGLEALARGASLEDVGSAARVVDKILPGAKDRALIESMGHASAAPLGGVRRVLETRPNRPIGVVATTVAEQARAVNPFRRMYEEKVVDRALTQPISKLINQRDALLEMGVPKNTRAEIDLKLLNETIDLARRNNLDRIARPATSSIRTWRLANKLTGRQKTAHIGRRDTQIAQWQKVLSELNEEQFDNFHTSIQMQVPDAPAPRLPLEQVEEAISDPGVLAHPTGRKIADLVRPQIEHLRALANYPDADPANLEAGRRIIEAVAEPLPYLGDDAVDVVVKTMDEARLLNFELEALPFLDAGGDYLTLFRRQYLPMRVAEKKARGLDSFEDATDPFQIDDELRDAGKKTPVYYPHYETLTKNKAPFLMSTNLHGARQKAQVSKYKKSSGIAFENHLKGIKDAYETNPVDAYSRLASEIVKHDQIESWIGDMAHTFGIAVTARDEIPSGYVAMNLDGGRMAIRKRRTIMERVHDNIENGQEEHEAFAEALEGLFSEPDKDIAEALGSQGAFIAVPKVVAKHIQAQTKASLNNAALRLFYDGPMGAWRNVTLYARPAYYVNNVFGNTTFLKLQGGKLTGVVRQLDKRYRDRIDQVIPEDLRGEVMGGWHQQPLQRSTHMRVAEDTVAGQWVKGVKESKVGQVTGDLRDRARDFNNFIEVTARRESFLTGLERQASIRGMKLVGNKWIRSERRLNQLMEVGANPKAARAAVDEMLKVMNDYNALSAFERKVIVRFFAPFYPFFKHATTTLIKLPFEHPAKGRVLEWLHIVGQDMDTFGARPEWLQGFIPVGQGDQPSEVRFLSTRGANPFAGVFENPVSTLSPVIQTALEQSTGRDVFTGKQFSAPDVYTDPISGQQFRWNPVTGQVEPAERRLGGLLAPVTPDAGETAMSLLPLATTVRNVAGAVTGGGGARYTASGDVIRNVAGAPTYPTSAVQELLKLVGASTVDYDLGAWQAKQLAAQERATTGLLERMLVT